MPDAEPTPPPQPTLETARLLLRPYRDEDAAWLIRWLSDKAVADGTLNVPHPYPPERATEFLREQAAWYAKGTGVSWAIAWRHDGTPVGGIGLRIVAAHRRAELGYWVAKPQWGAGIATEAGHAVVAYAFDVLGLHRLDAHHYTENPASGAVMRKLGMQHEGCLRAMVWRDGIPRDNELYSILATDPRP